MKLGLYTDVSPLVGSGPSPSGSEIQVPSLPDLRSRFLTNLMKDLKESAAQGSFWLRHSGHSLGLGLMGHY